MTQTYTTTEAMNRLGLRPTARTQFYRWRKLYPHAFAVVEPGGHGLGNVTRYDAAKIDKLADAFATLREMEKGKTK